MESLNKEFDSCLSARMTKLSSGCAETDSCCRPVQVYFGEKSSLNAELNADYYEQNLKLKGYNVERLGPRDLKISKDYIALHHTELEASF